MRQKLSEEEIQSHLAQLPGWTIEDGHLTRTFGFKTYAHGVLFTVAVGHLADQMDHHPDLLTSYQKVRVALSTHDVGGISNLDFELARQIDAIA